MGNIDGEDEGGTSATVAPPTPSPETPAPVRRGGPGTASEKRTGKRGISDSPEALSAANRRAEAAAAAARERNRYRHHLNGICRLLWHGSWVQTAYDRTVCEGINVKVSVGNGVWCKVPLRSSALFCSVLLPTILPCLRLSLLCSS